MSGWDDSALGPPVVSVEVDLYTAGFRVTGHMRTRFRRVGEILNLTGSSHLVVDDGTVTEYAAPGQPRSGPPVMVSVDAVLFGLSSGTDDSPTEELRIQKRPVRAQLSIGPFWLDGQVHVPQGSRPMDGLLNVADRFLPLTDVTITSAAYPGFARTAPVLAIQRNLAQVLMVADDEDEAERLAEIFPEDRSAGSWPTGG